MLGIGRTTTHQQAKRGGPGATALLDASAASGAQASAGAVDAAPQILGIGTPSRVVLPSTPNYGSRGAESMTHKVPGLCPKMGDRGRDEIPSSPSRLACWKNGDLPDLPPENWSRDDGSPR